MTHGSLFAGIGGFDLGFRNAGFSVSWQVEKEPFCQAILKTRFPEAKLFNDVREVGQHNLADVDVLTAGFPCQDLSVAGKRAGLEGARSGLFWEVVRILGELRPTWFVLENVPGLFSSNAGRDFAVVLNALDELGYGVAWRVLNSQFFGVAQRRRRVFIVGRFGKPCPAEVLFESEGGSGDFAESGEMWPRIAVPLTSGIGITSNAPGRRREDEHNLAIANPISSHNQAEQSYRGDGRDNLVAGFLAGNSAGAGSIGYREEQSPTLKSSASGTNQVPTIIQQAISSKWAKGSSGPAGDEHHNLTVCIQDVRGGTRDKTDAGQGIGIRESEIMYTLDGTSQHAVASLSGIGNGGPDDNDGQANRIVECAPLDSNGMRDFASLPKGLDSARYRALGNAVTASVAEWIGRRIIAAASPKPAF